MMPNWKNMNLLFSSLIILLQRGSLFVQANLVLNDFLDFTWHCSTVVAGLVTLKLISITAFYGLKWVFYPHTSPHPPHTHTLTPLFHYRHPALHTNSPFSLQTTPPHTFLNLQLQILYPKHSLPPIQFSQSRKDEVEELSTDHPNSRLPFWLRPLDNHKCSKNFPNLTCCIK